MSFSDKDQELADFRTRIFQETGEEIRRLLPQVAADAAARARERTRGHAGETKGEQHLAAGQWPEPGELPGGLRPVPPLPEVMIPEPLRPWLVDIAERIQCDLSFPTIGAVTEVAALIGRRVGIRPKRHDDWLVVPNLWGAVIGRPGILKTPALAEVMKPLHRLELHALKQYEEDLKSWEKIQLTREAERAALKHRLTSAAKKGTPLDAKSFTLPDPTQGEPVPVRYLVNDSTVEKLGVILNHNPRGVLLFRDELTGWLRTLDREGHENDRAFYLEAWNGNGAYTYDRIGRGTLHIKAACVSILGGIQPGPLADYLRAAVRGGAGDDGLMQRFQLAVYPDDPGPWRNVDRWPDTAAKNGAFTLFERLSAFDPSAIGAASPEGEDIPFLRFTPQAQELFDRWRADLEQKIRARDEHPVLEAHLSKYRSLMPSLALLLHLLEVVDGAAEGPVSHRVAAVAAGWCDFLEAHARRIYRGVTHRALFSAKRLAERIAASALPSPFTAGAVLRKGWAGLSTVEDVRDAAELLEDLHWLQAEKPPAGERGGRPRFHYLINPRLPIATDSGGEAS